MLIDFGIVTVNKSAIIIYLTLSYFSFIVISASFFFSDLGAKRKDKDSQQKDKESSAEVRYVYIQHQTYTIISLHTNKLFPP